MEKRDAERAVPPAYTAPVVYQELKGKNKTLCAVGVTVLICTIVLVTGIVLTAHFVKSAPSKNSTQTPQRFEVNVNLNDKTEKEEIEVDPEKKEIVITQKNANIVTLEDFKTGYIASKDIDNRTCFVMPISENRKTDSFDEAYKSAEEAKNNGTLTVEGTIKKKPLMDQVIHPDVLRYTAGESIAGFCAGFDSHWLVDEPENNDDDREKRAAYICINTGRKLLVLVGCGDYGCVYRIYDIYRCYRLG